MDCLQDLVVITKEMNISVYEQIIVKRGGDPFKFVHGRALAKQQFRNDLIKGKVVWYNDFRKDFWCYVRIHHELVSILYAPIGHNYNRFHRFIIFLSTLCITFCWSSIQAYFHANSISSTIWFTIVEAICTAIITRALKCCLVCQCCDNNTREIRRCAKCAGYTAATLPCFYSFMFLSIGIGFFTANHENHFVLFILFILTTVLTYIIELLFDFYLFQRQWKKEHQLALRNQLKQASGFFVTFEEYLHFKDEEISLQNDIPINQNEFNIPLIQYQ